MARVEDMSPVARLQRDGSESPPAARGPMEDEYGTMNSDGETAVVQDFELESGERLPEARTRYRTWGRLNKQRNNAIVVCHALTGNANLESWWGAILGPGKPLDTKKYFIFCSNVLGGCYGTSGPSSLNPKTGKPYGSDFPAITIRDMVQLQVAVLKQLEVAGLACVVGGSMGGMQALEYALLPESSLRPRAMVSMSSNGRHQPWQIGIGECQRQAIYADPLWNGGHYAPDSQPHSGVAVARMMAMVTYRSHPGYWTKFGRSTRTISHQDAHQEQIFEVESYLRYQGKRFHERNFDANSYISLTCAMDSHDVSRGRGEYFEVLQSITMPVLIVSISSDVLYPYTEQLELAEHLPNAQHHMIQSNEGHDGFLLEDRKIGTLLRGFLADLSFADDVNGKEKDNAEGNRQ